MRRLQLGGLNELSNTRTNAGQATRGCKKGVFRAKRRPVPNLRKQGNVEMLKYGKSQRTVTPAL